MARKALWPPAAARCVGHFCSGPPARKSDEAEGLAFGFEHGKRVKGIEPSTSTLAR